MPWDAGLLARCLDALDAAGVRPVRHKSVFGMRGLLIGKRMFAAVGGDGLIVRLRPEAVAGALARPGVTRFMPGGESLGTWVALRDDVVADDPELREWLEAGVHSLR